MNSTQQRKPGAVPTSVCSLLLGLAVCLLLPWGVSPAAAATDVAPTLTPSPITTPTSTAEPTLTPTPTATATTTPSATATPRPKPTTLPVAPPSRDRKPHHRHSAAASTPAALAAPTVRPTDAPTATSTVTTKKESAHRAHHAPSTHRISHHARKRTRPTATPTATPTPPINLNTENSISPVTCNGPARPAAAHPFLAPPYRGWTSIVSYFDHDLPDFSQDGLVITSNGMEARPDSLHHASDFPAYWNTGLRQYVYYDGHNGYDYDLFYQPVYAAAAGKVIYAAPEYSYDLSGGYGNMIMVNHGHGYVTLYGHFSKILVKKGQRVKGGQEIGISGNTGHSSGPHLHFTVFHNCTPTDPYGWTGGGDDPLAGYQGEQAEYLWVRAPLVTNPLPDWPGLATMPGPGLPRLILLRLPTTGAGAAAFARALQVEASAVERALQADGGITSFDPLRGALQLLGPVPPARIYALRDVASIGSSDVAGDARSDVLHAFALAALATKHKVVGLDRSHRWTGYLLRWDGQTFLVGRGEKGKAVKLQLPLSKSKRLVRHVEADPSSGAYAVDLGNMSPQEMTALVSNLRNANVRKSPPTAQPERRVRKRPASVTRKAVSASDVNGPLVAFLLLTVAVAAAVFGASKRLRHLD